MLIKIKAIGLCVFALFISCKQANYVTVKDEAGHISEKYQVNENEEKNGTYESYIDGVLVEKSLYKNGKLNGKRTLFHKNGQIEIDENYIDDQLTGTYKSYYEDGTLSQEANYIDGKMEGVLKTYFNSGTLKEEVMMVDNNENGPFKEFHENGKLSWEGTYLNGDNEFGLIQEYNDQGALIKKMMCDSMARCTTIWTIETGDIKSDKS